MYVALPSDYRQVLHGGVTQESLSPIPIQGYHHHHRGKSLDQRDEDDEC